MDQIDRDFEDKFDVVTDEAEASSTWTGLAALLWVLALVALACAPAAVIWAWRWFL